MIPALPSSSGGTATGQVIASRLVASYFAGAMAKLQLESQELLAPLLVSAY
jgi:hypothetical protein